MHFLCVCVCVGDPGVWQHQMAMEKKKKFPEHLSSLFFLSTFSTSFDVMNVKWNEEIFQISHPPDKSEQMDQLSDE